MKQTVVLNRSGGTLGPSGKCDVMVKKKNLEKPVEKAESKLTNKRYEIIEING